MFTGLVEHMVVVLDNLIQGDSRRLILSSPPWSDLVLGESIAVNGVCLTLIASAPDTLAFDVSPETLRCTTLAILKPQAFVHLERALSVSQRFGGHYVSGHVDTTARIAQIQVIHQYVELTLDDMGEESAAYLLPKGSITVQGVSLTINDVNKGTIKLLLVPHTLEKTIFKHAQMGQRVNIEFDYLTRIVAHQLRLQTQQKIEVDEV